MFSHYCQVCYHLSLQLDARCSSSISSTQELHALLLECLEAEGLSWHAQQVDEYAAHGLEEFGILGANTDYEGGFVALYVEHRDAPGWEETCTLF